MLPCVDLYWCYTLIIESTVEKVNIILNDLFNIISVEIHTYFVSNISPFNDL